MMKTKVLTLFAAITTFGALGFQAPTPAQNRRDKIVTFDAVPDAQTFSTRTNAGGVGPIPAFQIDPKAQAKLLGQYGKVPLSFEVNQGQNNPGVRFLSRGAGYALFLTSDEAVFTLRGSNANDDASAAGRHLHPSPGMPATDAVLRMKFVNADHAAKVTGVDELPGKTNYFIGSDPKKWRTNVPTFAKVKYENIYPGVDLVYYGNQKQLEYDFVVSPGADPGSIEFELKGSQKKSIDAEGDLALGVNAGAVQFQRPLIYQETGGVRREIAGNYVLRGTDRVGFQVEDYDHGKPLVIDPVLVYSTYLGGTGQGAPYDIAADSSGNAYVTGQTYATDFPTTPGAFQTTNVGDGYSDAFVTKLNSSGTALVYSTYLGGSLSDWGQAIAIDPSGNAYVTGATQSTNFPTTAGAFQTTFSSSSNTAGFVAKLNSTGSALLYSTYLGSGGLSDSGIAVDSSGNAYLTGAGFVLKLNSDGSAPVYSTVLDGTGEGIAVDSLGEAYVTGTTSSIDFPIIGGVGTHINSFENVMEVFLTKLNSSGSAAIYSTWIGGGHGYGIAIDTSGNAYVVGVADNGPFPTTPGAFQATDNSDSPLGFVSKVNNTGSAFVYSTFLGGSNFSNYFGGNNYVKGIAVDSSGNAYVTGATSSTNFPTTPGALQTTYGGGAGDAFVSELNSNGSALVYSTYLGGSSGDAAEGIAIDSSGSVYVTGVTSSTNFPTTAGAFQTTFGNSNLEGFVTKIASINPDTIPPITTATPLPGANSYGWNNTNVTVTLNSTDNEAGGTGVKQITYSAIGAQAIGTTVVNGASTTLTLSTEGITTITFFATDNAGNVESTKTLTIQLDKTPPTITPLRTPPPNTNGWNKTNVTVSFQCSDSLSGLSAGSPPNPTTLSTEGAGQSVTGTCTDLAGNSVSATVGGIDIDKTPPTVACSASPNVLWPPNNKLVPVNVSVTLTDVLSGAAGFTLVSVTSNEPDSGQGDIQGFATGTPSTSGQLRAQRLGSGNGRAYTFTYSGSDRAGNTVSCTTTVSVPHDQGN